VSVLDEVSLAGFADLYRALAPLMTPAEADEHELWQLAALLGLDRPHPRPGSDLDRLAARVEAEKESLRLRAGTGPSPSSEVAEPVDVTERIMRSMGISTR